jgi:hypothetical protein
MGEELLPSRRVVISLSLSASNPDAQLVAEKLAAAGVPLTRGSAQILAWAAAYLSGATAVLVQASEPGISEDELDALLDDF